MATIRYSNLYGRVPTNSTASGEVTQSNTWTYKGPTITKKSEPITISGSYDLSNGTLDATDTQLFLMPLPSGSRLLEFQLAPSADLDSDSDFTFDLGNVALATAYATASTALQATTGFSLPATIATDLAQAIILGSSESLILTRAAGELNTSGTLYFSAKIAWA